MSRATKALAALAVLAAAASAAHPAAAQPAAAGAAPANCSRHIRVGVFDDANPIAAAFQTGWMDNAATACYSCENGFLVDRRRLTPRMREVFPFIRHAVVQIG